MPTVNQSGGDREQGIDGLMQFLEIFQTNESKELFGQTLGNEEFKSDMMRKFRNGESYNAIRQILEALD